jgi:hypothetical protein
VSDRRNIGDILEAVACHVFRHRGTGDEAVLAADRIEGPGGDAWWSISLDCDPGSAPAKTGLRATVWCGTSVLARQAFAERQQALRAAGYERVDG